MELSSTTAVLEEACLQIEDLCPVLHILMLFPKELCPIISQYCADIEAFETVVMNESSAWKSKINYGLWLSKMSAEIADKKNKYIETWITKAKGHYFIRNLQPRSLYSILEISETYQGCQRSSCYKSSCICHRPLIYFTTQQEDGIR